MIREYLGMFLGGVGDVLGELRQWLRDVSGLVKTNVRVRGLGVWAARVAYPMRFFHGSA